MNFFVGWGPLEEDFFEKPVPLKIQDGRQVDIMDFVMEEWIGRLTWNFVVVWASLV
jgi:hypothetical protein